MLLSVFGAAQIRNYCDTAEERDKSLLANGALKDLIYFVALQPCHSSSDLGPIQLSGAVQNPL